MKENYRFVIQTEEKIFKQSKIYKRLPDIRRFLLSLKPYELHELKVSSGLSFHLLYIRGDIVTGHSVLDSYLEKFLINS